MMDGAFSTAIIGIVLGAWLLAGAWALWSGLSLRRRAEDSLRQTARLGRLIDTAPAIPLIVRLDGKVDTPDRLLGWLGVGRNIRHMSDLSSDAGDGGFAPEDVDRLNEHVRLAQRTGKSFECTFSIVGSDRALAIRGGLADSQVYPNGAALLWFFDRTEPFREQSRLQDEAEAARAAWVERQQQAAGEGLRVLALAMKYSDGPDEDPYEGLSLVGLVCLADPLRADVPDAIRSCLEAGVKVVVLTGDHANTAEAIVRQMGLGANEITVIEGAELSDLDVETADRETVARLLDTAIFARVAPDTKLKLVSLYQKNGHVVAMTGDGVNDAPALKKADIGIAMGQRGTQVAREAAVMILKDDAFGTIIAAMRQGREIYDNIRRFVIYLMSCNVSEVLVVGFAVGAGLPMPLLPLQILFLNLVTDVFPAFALGFGRGDEGIMQRAPRNPAEAILNRAQWHWIGLLGGFITLATLGAFAIALFVMDLAPPEAVTVAFLTLALAQLWNVFNMRAPSSRVFINEITTNGHIWTALTLCSGLITLAVALPAASDVLGLPNPGAGGLGLAIGMSLVPLVLRQILISLRQSR